MEELRIHILELAELSVAAGAAMVRITITEDLPADWLTIELADDGRGIKEEQLKLLQKALREEPPSGEAGLEVALFARSCEEAEGQCSLNSSAEEGTVLCGRMRHSHPNRKPLGDLEETLISLLMSAPGVDWVYTHRKIHADGAQAEVELDTRQIRRKTGDLPLTHPEVVRVIRSSLREQTAKMNSRRPAPGSREK